MKKKGKSYRECAWVNGSWVRRIAPKKYTKVDFTKSPLSVTDVVPEEWITQEKVITHVQKFVTIIFQNITFVDNFFGK